MKKLILLCFILFSIGLQDGIQAQPTNLEISEEAIASLHLIKFKWMIQKDTLQLSLLLDDNVRYIHSNGWIEYKQEVLDNIASGKLTYHNVAIKEYEARQFNDTYIITGKGLFSVSLEGKAIDINLYYTEIYIINQEEKIKLVSRHACKI